MNGILNLEYYLYLQFTFMAQLFACQMFLTPKTMEKRDHFGWMLFLKIVIDIMVSFIAYLYQFFFGSTFINTLVIYLSMYLLSSLSYLFAFDATFKDGIYITTIGYVFQHIAYKCNYLIFDVNSNASIQNNAYQGVYPSYSDQVTMVTQQVVLGYLLNIFLQLLLYGVVDLILCLIFAKKFKNNYEKSVSNIYTIEISLLSLLITVVLNTFFLYATNTSKALSIIIAILTMLVCFFILYNCSIQMELSASKRDKILLESQYNEKIRQYEMTKESVDLINIKCHDLRKQIRYLKENNQGFISNDELTKIEQAIRIYDTSLRTGNDTLDTILQEKSLVMNRKGIVGTFLINGQSLSFMKREDIFSLFENILDNAIEALDEIEDKEKRTFSLKVSKMAGFVSIEESNYFGGGILEFDKNGLPRTTKKDNDYHGFGTKSIKYVVDHLNGKVRYSTNGEIFTLKIIIPTKD